MDFVRTKHGLMTKGNARSLDLLEKHQREARTEMTRRFMLRRALEAGVSEATFNRLWKNGYDLLERRIAHVKKLAAKPRHELEKLYPCLACRVFGSDSYKAGCKEKQLVPCFLRAAGGVLRGCEALIPRLIVAGHTPEARPAPTPGAPTEKETTCSSA